MNAEAVRDEVNGRVIALCLIPGTAEEELFLDMMRRAFDAGQVEHIRAVGVQVGTDVKTWQPL